MENTDKLLAGFLGMKPHHNDSNVMILNINGINYPFEVSELNYDTDWNRLMLVIEKIESVKIGKLYFNIQIDKDKVSLFYTHISEPTKQIEMFFEWGQENKINNTYKIVVEFVKWYNEQKK